MTHQSDKEHDSDTTDLPEGPQAPPLKTPFEEVSGSSSAAYGYNRLEETQRAVRQHSIGQHQTEMLLWYRGLTLYYVAQIGTWDLSGTSNERVVAQQVQMDLLGLGLSSGKVSLDLLIVGYYSPTYATIRHMLETVMQWFYLELFPERAYLWRTPSTSENRKQMAMKTMRSRLVKRAKKFQPKEEGLEFVSHFNQVYRYWGRMSAGSHPSGTGLAQVVFPESRLKRQTGANYNRHTILVGFSHGLFALRELLAVFRTTNRVDDEWQERLNSWNEEVEDYREAAQQDPVVVKVEAELEKLRKAQLEPGEGTE